MNTATRRFIVIIREPHAEFPYVVYDTKRLEIAFKSIEAAEERAQLLNERDAKGQAAWA